MARDKTPPLRHQDQSYHHRQATEKDNSEWGKRTERTLAQIERKQQTAEDSNVLVGKEITPTLLQSDSEGDDVPIVQTTVKGTMCR